MPATGGLVPGENALISGNGAGPSDGGAQGPSMGLGMSAERAAVRDRTSELLVGNYSASREGKRLNMLGFNNNHQLENA